VWTVQAAGFVSSLGHGAVVPFVLIYLHDVRRFELATAGLVAGTFSLVAIVAGPAAGPLIDGIGAKASLLIALALMSLGYGAFAFTSAPAQAFAAAAVAGVGQAGFSPSHSSLLVALAPSDRLPQAFALRRAADNLGLGLGASLGGLLITGSDQPIFRALFLADALTTLLFAAVVLAVRKPSARTSGGRFRGTYRDVLRTPTLLALNALIFVLAAAGFAQVGSTFTAYAKDDLALTARTIGLIFLLNALTVTVLALPAARLLEGRRPMHGVAFIGLAWAAAWLVTLSAEAWHGQPLSS
jgi:MFS family permease